MHPIISHPRRLATYAAAWLFIAFGLVNELVLLGIPRQEAIVLMLGLTPEYAAVCLMAWHPCRATPLHSAGILRIAVTQTAAAILFSGAWTLIAFLYAQLLSITTSFRNVVERPSLLKAFFAMGFVLYLLSAALYYVLIANEKSDEAEEQAREAQVLARDAELRALKAQINPHFLFNSLNSISALTTIDPARAREMCITLADFLRSTLGLGEKAAIPLEEEIALIHRFLTVEKVRFGQRLNVEEDIDPSTLSYMIPPLLLQPLVENAVIHGVANMPKGGTVKIVAKNGDGRLDILVENDFDPDYRPKRSKGIGIPNVRERLARYGKDSIFDADIFEHRFRVRLSLPAERNTAS
jgi:sensor histidine kinase YesM